jgi:hypothetical protein
MWCIQKITREYRKRMYAILDLYEEPFDSKKPVIGLDEKPKQLIDHARKPIPAAPGKIAKEDYEYKRNGNANVFLAVEPKGGKRFTSVTKRRTKKDFASFVKNLVEVRYPRAKVIRIVLDNLNTHNESSFYENLNQKVASRITKRIEFHYTPKHASWLNVAECEIGIMDSQCTEKRIKNIGLLASEVKAWTKRRNREGAKINWTFTKQKADEKLGKYYVT